MAWDPAVLRKFNTTGHFRLLNQLRSELKGNPLIRPRDGETVGAANRSRSLTRALEARAQSGYGPSRRSQAATAEVVVVSDPQELARPAHFGSDDLGYLGGFEMAESGSSSFRDRLSAIDMR
jgi:hypothetical protein